MQRQSSERLLRHMKHYQMTTGGRSTTRQGAVRSPGRAREEAGTTSVNILASTLTIYSETLTCMDTTLTCTIKDISRATFRPTKKHTGGTSRTLSAVTCLMMCLRIWRGCSLLMDTRLRLKTGFTDPAGSTVGLSHSERVTWSQHSPTALELMCTWKCLPVVFIEMFWISTDDLMQESHITGPNILSSGILNLTLYKMHHSQHIHNVINSFQHKHMAT